VTTETDSARELLRHTLATVAYRGGKTLRDAPPEFATFRAGDTARTPLEILAHLGDCRFQLRRGKRNGLTRTLRVGTRQQHGSSLT